MTTCPDCTKLETLIARLYAIAQQHNTPGVNHGTQSLAYRVMREIEESGTLTKQESEQ